MADEARNQAGPFDVRTIEQLVALMSQHELSEMDLREGEQRICLRRGGFTAVAPAPLAVERPVPTALPAPKAAEASSSASSGRVLHDIKSPTVGTFYTQEKPGAPPYVSIGSRVTPTTIVGQIVAMKIFNEITADCSGVIAEVCAQNEEFVEFGTVLFRVDPNA